MLASQQQREIQLFGTLVEEDKFLKILRCSNTSIVLLIIIM